ncbi:MAG: MFS transporter [Cyanobacteria bacterium SZAS TMP-1]|nr:MFS transporter [Cyanobacteria bacterium SZAS TMP-1]
MLEQLLELLFSLPGRISGNLRQTFKSLSDRNFRVYNLGMFLSNVGTWMQGVALSWLVYRLTGSAAALGLISFASNIPLLLLTFVGGMAADRYDKRKVLFITQILAMLQAIVLTVLVALNLATIPILIGMAVFLGIVTAFDVPARQSLVPLMVKDPNDMPNAIGLSSATFHVSRMIGPAVGGLLIASFGETICFGLNAVSFIAALIGLARISVPNARPVEKRKKGDAAGSSGDKPQETIMQTIRRPEVFTLLFLAAFVSTFGMQYSILMPVIVDKLLHGQSAQFGMLSACAGLGALMGALTIAATGTRPGLRSRIGQATLGLAFALCVLAFSRIMALSVVAIIACGTCLSTHWSGGNSLMQKCVDPSARGRLMGVYTTFTLGLAPLTALISGWTAEHYGVTVALLISASGMLLGSTLYLWRVRKLDDSCDAPPRK